MITDARKASLNPIRHPGGLRPARRGPSADVAARRSVDQPLELVGRVSLREIGRESTEGMERLCIEAALQGAVTIGAPPCST